MTRDRLLSKTQKDELASEAMKKKLSRQIETPSAIDENDVRQEMELKQREDNIARREEHII